MSRRKSGFFEVPITHIPRWLRDRSADTIVFRVSKILMTALLLVGVIGVGIFFGSSRGDKPIIPVPNLPLASVTSPQPPMPSAPQSKVMLDTDVYQLKNIIHDHTDQEATRLFSQYVTKWLKITGEVDNLEPWNQGWLLYIVLPPRGDKDLLVEVLRFSGAWRDRLADLPHGQRIVALCQIGSEVGVPLLLENCELVGGHR